MKTQQWVAILSSGLAMCLFSCSNNEVTFAQDVAPIIHANCSPCHHKNGAGPFALISFEEVSEKAKTIVDVTTARYMPPWPADPNYSHFKEEKFLTDEQIALIAEWVKQGKKSGDLSKLIYPKFEFYSSLGKPDLLLDLPKINISGNALDQFLMVKVPGMLGIDTFVRAIEFIPGQKQYVHHVNGYLLNYLDKPKFFDDATNPVNIESKNYAQEVKGLHLIESNMPVPQRIHSAFNYLPGVFAANYPEGIGGFKLNKYFALVCNDLHYGSAEKDTFDHSKIAIYFSKKAPKRPTKELMMGTNGVAAIVPPLVLQPNEKRTFYSSLYIPESISILTLNPHMHLLGTAFKAYAIAPNKDTIPLIKIPEWDFRWQYFYTFIKMLKIPAGSTIKLEASFDNTLDNTNNPYNPPRIIKERSDLFGAGMRTKDEMLQFIITYLPYQVGDEEIKL